MYNLLLKLIVGATVLELARAVLTERPANLSIGALTVHAAERELVQIEWQPIIVFPTENRKFRR